MMTNECSSCSQAKGTERSIGHGVVTVEEDAIKYSTSIVSDKKDLVRVLIYTAGLGLILFGASFKVCNFLAP